MAPVIVNIIDTEITSKTTMGVLKVLFDSKMQWVRHIATAIKKANKTPFLRKKFILICFFDE